MTHAGPGRRRAIVAGVAALAVAGAAVPVIASAGDDGETGDRPAQRAASVAGKTAAPANASDGTIAVAPPATAVPATAAPTTAAPTTAAPTTVAPTTTTVPAATVAQAVATWKAAEHANAVARYTAAANLAKANARKEAAATMERAVARNEAAKRAEAVALWNRAAARSQATSRQQAATAAWYRAASRQPARPAPAPKAPAPAPKAAPARPAAPAPAVGGGGVWDKIAQCESGGNWSINTGNGYYGGLQFTLSSWRGVGGTGMPHQASRETQIQMGIRLQAQQGWGAWPMCSRKAGLR